MGNNTLYCIKNLCSPSEIRNSIVSTCKSALFERLLWRRPVTQMFINIHEHRHNTWKSVGYTHYNLYPTKNIWFGREETLVSPHPKNCEIFSQLRVFLVYFWNHEDKQLQSTLYGGKPSNFTKVVKFGHYSCSAGCLNLPLLGNQTRAVIGADSYISPYWFIINIIRCYLPV